MRSRRLMRTVYQHNRFVLFIFAMLAFGLGITAIAPGTLSGIASAQGLTPMAPTANAPGMSPGTAFAHQGQLKKAGVLVNSTCNFRFNLWADSGGTIPAGNNPQTASGVSVTNGLFTTYIDFGSGAFTGDARWLGTAVQCTGDSGFTALTPLEPLMPAPMAFALPGLYTQQNGTSPNIIGGYSGNTIGGGVNGATISGGGANGTINQISANNATIGGGVFNSASGVGATIGGGGDDGNAPTGNAAQANASTISGGLGNTIQGAGTYSTIGGGAFNLTKGYASNVGGGYQNSAYGDYSTVAGGLGNSANGIGSFVGGGGTSGPAAANTANGNGSTISGGSGNATLATGTMATIGGGYSNTADGGDAVVSGGFGNKALFTAATIGGGGNNTATGYYGTIGGGDSNQVGGQHATIPGGGNNIANGESSFAAGNGAQALHDNTFVWADQSVLAPFASTAKNQFLIRAGGGVGINTNQPVAALNVSGTGWFQGDNTPLSLSAGKGIGIGFVSGQNPYGYVFAYDYGLPFHQNLILNGPGGYVGIGTTTPIRTLEVNGTLRVDNLGNGTSSQTLCYTSLGDITACGLSSLRYKTNVANLTMGLDAIAKLRPVTYEWKADGQPDLGFVAEQVNEVTPLLTTYNKDGQIEGVKYDHITAILVKGIQEQQAQVLSLQSQVSSLQSQNAALEQKNSDLETRLSAIEETLQELRLAARTDRNTAQ